MESEIWIVPIGAVLFLMSGISVFFDCYWKERCRQKKAQKKR